MASRITVSTEPHAFSWLHQRGTPAWGEILLCYPPLATRSDEEPPPNASIKRFDRIQEFRTRIEDNKPGYFLPVSPWPSSSGLRPLRTRFQG